MKKLNLIFWVSIIFLFSSVSFAEITKTQIARVYYSNDFERARLLSMDLDIATGDPSLGYFEIVTEPGLVDILRRNGFRVEILISDLAKYYGEPEGGVFGKYYTFSEAVNAIMAIRNSYPNIVRIDTLGRSFENRVVYGVKVSDNVGVEEPEPEALFTAVQHAREPIGVSIHISFLNWITQNYGTDSIATWLVNNRELWFMPVFNPDGYVYNEGAGARNWRKTRSGPRSGCYGADPNRNWPFKWGYDDIGSSPNPCSEIYRGPSAASETETQAAHNLVMRRRFVTQYDIHSYGQVILIPFSYINSRPYGAYHDPVSDTVVYNEMGRELVSSGGMTGYGHSYQMIGYNSNGNIKDYMWGDSVFGNQPKYHIWGVSSEVGTSFWQGLNDTNVIVTQCEQDRGRLLYLSEVSGVWLVHQSHLISGGNGDTLLDPGEIVQMQVTLRNKAVQDTAIGTTATMTTNDARVTVSGTGSFGNIIRLRTGTNSGSRFTVRALPTIPPGTWVRFYILARSNAGGSFPYARTDTFSIRIGNRPVGVEENQISNIKNQNLNLEIYPNPATSVANFKFQISDSRLESFNLQSSNLQIFQSSNLSVFQSSISIKIYDVQGRLVRQIQIANPKSEIRNSNVAWDLKDETGKRVSAGKYFVRFEIGEKILSKEVILIR